MGYFNYFVKCIIRNISYKLCKPKVFLTVLLSVIILFVLHSTGYCVEWSQIEIDKVISELNNVHILLERQVDWLSTIEGDTTSIRNQLVSIKSSIDSLDTNVADIESTVSSILSQMNSLNTNITNIYSQLESHHQELIIELQTENEKVLNELEEMKKILMGADLDVKNLSFFPTSFIRVEPSLSSSSSFETSVVSGTVNSAYSILDYQFEGGYTYDIVCNSANNSAYSRIYYTYDTVSTGSNIYLNYAGNYTPSRVAFTISPKKNSTVTLLFSNPSAFGWSMSWTITKKSAGSLSGINSTIEQGNQLQQEQNQLQQEQNDFLKQETTDNDVSIDSFNSVDANDITSSGLTGIFTTIYNSINSWSSKDIVLPIPFTNKSLTIPANYTYNMLSSVGGGFLITIISTVYYFIVARFIIYSITGIINSIKSGSILETDTKNNITTEML